MTFAASIVIPTRDRPEYLAHALSSIVPQAKACKCEVLVVDDSASHTAQTVAQRGGARCLSQRKPLGANAARNAGVRHTSGDLLVFVDDDVQACDGWLQALLQAAQAHPERDVFAGRIQPLLEGAPPRSCGREPAPITTLDLGEADRETRFAWSANMALRRGALLRAGPFDTSLHGQGEEQEWQERALRIGGSPPLYVAGARLMHRRIPADATLRALSAHAWRRGIEARRFDRSRGQAPSISGELSTLLRCGGHVLRYRCPAGLTMVAHSCGRVSACILERAESRAVGPSATDGPRRLEWEAAEHRDEPSDDFLSGESGTVGGLDGVRRRVADLASDVLNTISGRRLRLAIAARRLQPQRVLALGIVRARHQALADEVIAELRKSRHQVAVHTVRPGDAGKFENLNSMLREHTVEDHDWLIVFDDDIELPAGFLDRFLFLAQRFGLDLAQPAHRQTSHAAWQVTRRRPRSVLRETLFVEIGPLTAFSSRTFSTLLPFPPLRMGWGLDAHWGALAREHHWRCGVVDALPIYHRAAPAGEAYSRRETLAEAREFLSQRPYLTAQEAQRTLALHRRW